MRSKWLVGMLAGLSLIAVAAVSGTPDEGCTSGVDIRLRVYHDLNANGRHDAGEPYLTGWTIGRWSYSSGLDKAIIWLEEDIWNSDFMQGFRQGFHLVIDAVAGFASEMTSTVCQFFAENNIWCDALSLASDDVGSACYDLVGDVIGVIESNVIELVDLGAGILNDTIELDFRTLIGSRLPALGQRYEFFLELGATLLDNIAPDAVPTLLDFADQATQWCAQLAQDVAGEVLPEGILQDVANRVIGVTQGYIDANMDQLETIYGASIRNDSDDAIFQAMMNRPDLARGLFDAVADEVAGAIDSSGTLSDMVSFGSDVQGTVMDAVTAYLLAETPSATSILQGEYDQVAAQFGEDSRTETNLGEITVPHFDGYCFTTAGFFANYYFLLKRQPGWRVTSNGGQPFARVEDLGLDDRTIEFGVLWKPFNEVSIAAEDALGNPIQGGQVQIGDRVTLRFVSPGYLLDSLVTVFGRPVTASLVADGAEDGFAYVATTTIEGNDPAGEVPFSIRYELADRSRGEVTETTDGSSYSLTKETLDPVRIAGPDGAELVTIGDAVTLTFRSASAGRSLARPPRVWIAGRSVPGDAITEENGTWTARQEMHPADPKGVVAFEIEAIMDNGVKAYASSTTDQSSATFITELLRFVSLANWGEGGLDDPPSAGVGDWVVLTMVPLEGRIIEDAPVARIATGDTATWKEETSSWKAARAMSYLDPEGRISYELDFEYDNLIRGHVEGLSDIEFVVLPDFEPPSNPTVTCTHFPGVPDDRSMVEFQISGARDDLWGVDGFEVAWTTDADWSPSRRKTHEETWTGGSFLASVDGEWFFCIATVDNAANWSEPLVLGPYAIDTAPPSLLVDVRVNGKPGIYGRSGDEVSVAFISSEPLANYPTVAFGSSRPERAVGSGIQRRRWTATFVIDASTADGVLTYTIQCQDLAGNPRTVSGTAALIDTSPPTAPLLLSPPDGESTPDRDVLFSWTGSADPSGGTGLAGYELVLGGIHSEMVFVPRDTASHQLLDLPEGDYQWRVRAVDVAGNISESPVRSLTIDYSGPSVEVNQAPGQLDPTGELPVCFVAAFSEQVYGFDVGDVVISGTADASTVSIVGVDEAQGIYELWVSGLPAGVASGTISIAIADGAAQDSAGNTSYGSTSDDNTVFYSASTPRFELVRISSSNARPELATVGDTVTLEFTVSETIRSEDTVVSIAGHPVDAQAPPGPPRPYVATYVLTDEDVEGDVGFSIDVTDFAGNPGHTTVTTPPYTSVTFDRTAPTLERFARDLPSDEATNADVLRFKASFDEPVTHVDASDFTVDGSTTAAVSVVGGSGGAEYIVTVFGGDLPGYDGVVGLDLAATQDVEDLAGNPLSIGEPGVDQTYLVDNTTPIDPAVVSPSHGVDVWSADPSVEMSVSGAEDPLSGGVSSGVDGFEIAWNQSATWPPIHTKTHEETWAGGTFTATADGDWYVHLATVDAASNWTGTVHLGPFKVDVTSPSEPGLLSPANDLVSNARTHTFRWSAAVDGTSGIASYRLEIAGPDARVITLPTTATSNEVTLTQDGAYTWTVVAVDKAGNEAQQAARGLVIDTVPPDMSSVDLRCDTHDGATWSSSHNFGFHFCDATDPDPGSGVKGYVWAVTLSPTSSITGTPTPGDELAAGPVPDTLSVSVDKQGEVSSAVYYIHLRAQDNALNWSETVHLGPLKADLHDPSVPVITSCSHDEYEWSNDSSVEITWSASDDAEGSGIAGYTYKWNTTRNPVGDAAPAKELEGPDSITTTAETCSMTETLDDGAAHYFHVRAIDSSGRWSDDFETYGPMRIDTVAPDKPTNLSIEYLGALTRSWPACDDENEFWWVFDWSEQPQDDGSTILTRLAVDWGDGSPVYQELYRLDDASPEINLGLIVTNGWCVCAWPPYSPPWVRFRVKCEDTAGNSLGWSAWLSKEDYTGESCRLLE